MSKVTYKQIQQCIDVVHQGSQRVYTNYKELSSMIKRTSDIDISEKQILDYYENYENNENYEVEQEDKMIQGRVLGLY